MVFSSIQTFIWIWKSRWGGDLNSNLHAKTTMGVPIHPPTSTMLYAKQARKSTVQAQMKAWRNVKKPTVKLHGADVCCSYSAFVWWIWIHRQAHTCCCQANTKKWRWNHHSNISLFLKHPLPHIISTSTFLLGYILSWTTNQHTNPISIISIIYK